MSKQVTVARLPKCDVHEGDHEADYDIKVPGDGRWANVCEEFYQQVGSPELGTGRGQRLVLKEEGK